MYNETLKKEYIQFAMQDNRNLDVYLNSKFSALSKFEEKFNKDLYAFSVSEILEMYKLSFYSSLETLMTLNSQLKRYTNYCMNRHLIEDGQNHYYEMDNQLMMSCVSSITVEKSIVTREELLKEIDDLYNPSEKFLCLACFEGLRGKESEDILNLRANDFEGNIVHLASGRTFEVSDELLRYALESAAEYNYYGYILTDDKRERNFTFREDDDRVIKDLYNVVVSTPTSQKRNVYTKMTRIREYMGLNAISMKSLTESGRIDWIKTHFDSNKYKSYKEYYLENRDEIALRFGALASFDRWMIKYGKFL